MEILLTRHGKTEWNALGKVQGKADIKLNEEGIKQAKETSKLLQDEKIDLIISSPLIRAIETARIIAKERNIPIITDESLSERDFGEYEGKRILIVAHGGISIPVNCYFNGIPEDDNLLKLVLGNCEVAKYEYK